MKTGIILAAVCVLGAARVGAGDFNPIIPAQLRAGLASLKAVGGKAPEIPAPPALAFDPNVTSAIRAQMGQDLAFVGTIRGAATSRLHRDIFGPVDGPVYLRWFGSRVKAVGFDEKDSGPTTIAYVLIRTQPWKMWLTRNFIGYAMPQVARVMFMFHEARHTESDNGNWSHAVCPNPFVGEDGREVLGFLSGQPMAGKAACDRVARGSYGSATIMLKNISKFCANCTEKVRLDAGIYADDQVKRIIDPAARKEMRDDLYR